MKVREVLTEQARKEKRSDSWKDEEKEGERKGEGGKQTEKERKRERETLKSQTPLSFHFYPFEIKCFGKGRERERWVMLSKIYS